MDPWPQLGRWPQPGLSVRGDPDHQQHRELPEVQAVPARPESLPDPANRRRRRGQEDLVVPSRPQAQWRRPVRSHPRDQPLPWRLRRLQDPLRP
jgi:hypothetical protein